MNIKRTASLFTTIILLTSFFLRGGSVYASEPSFSIYPSGGTVVNKDNGFIVDVLIDTAGEKITSGRFTLLFDPSMLQLKKAERNNTLFAQYPNDESTIDNENGVVMLTGFTQSGSSTLYATGEKPDVFARLTFSVLKKGDAVLDWQYGGDTASFETAMYKEGSPPQNILLTKPSSATFAIGDDILDPSIINTGISMDKYVLATGLVLLLFGGFMVFTRPSGFRNRKGTVIVYDD